MGEKIRQNISLQTEDLKKVEKIEEGPQDTFYDTRPDLVLEEKNADVSYYHEGILHERATDVYRDQNGSAWFEIKKSPRKQMLISLLSQPFFNISTVIEVPEKKGGLSNFFLNINPRLSILFDVMAKLIPRKGSTFLSKKLNLDKVSEKTPEEMAADYMVFESIFDKGGQDRDIERQHNINLQGSNYALFDFDQTKIVPFKHFDESKQPTSFGMVSEGMDGYIYKMRKVLYGYNEFIAQAPKGVSVPEVPLAAIEETVRKLKGIKEFFEGEEGEKFVEAVLKKTKYEDEYRKEHKKEFEKGTGDNSYFDPHEVVKGLLAQTSYSARVLLDELKVYFAAETIDEEKYKPLLSELEELGKILEKMTSDPETLRLRKRTRIIW